MTTHATPSLFTLLTHEWLRTRTTLLTVAGGAAVVVTLGSVLAAPAWALLSVVTAFVAVGAAILLIPAVQILLAVDYWRSSYGREGYFTQTLPVRGPRIFWAKMLWAWLATLGAVAVSSLLLLAAWPGISRGLGMTERNPFALVSDAWGMATSAATVPGTLAFLGLILVMVLVWPPQYYFAASFGSEAPRNRLGAGGPVLTWVGLYLVTQLATAIGIFAIPYAIGVVEAGSGSLGIVDFNAWADLRSGNTSNDVFPLGVLPPILLVSAVCLWRTVRSWQSKVSLV